MAMMSSWSRTEYYSYPRPIFEPFETNRTNPSKATCKTSTKNSKSASAMRQLRRPKIVELSEAESVKVSENDAAL
jgi:hypothetical protein